MYWSYIPASTHIGASGCHSPTVPCMMLTLYLSSHCYFYMRCPCTSVNLSAPFMVNHKYRLLHETCYEINITF